MIIVNREKAESIATAELRGRRFEPEPGTKGDAGIIERVTFEINGREIWHIRSETGKEFEYNQSGPPHTDRLRQMCARYRGVPEKEIGLWFEFSW